MRRHDVLVGLPGARGVGDEVNEPYLVPGRNQRRRGASRRCRRSPPSFPEPEPISAQCLTTRLRNPGKNMEVNDASPLELNLPEPAARGPLPNPSPREYIEVALRAFRSRVYAIGKGHEEPVTAPPRPQAFPVDRP